MCISVSVVKEGPEDTVEATQNASEASFLDRTTVYGANPKVSHVLGHPLLGCAHIFLHCRTSAAGASWNDGRTCQHL